MSKTKCVMAVLIALISLPLVQCGGGPSSLPSAATASKPHVNGVWRPIGTPAPKYMATDQR